MEELTQESMPRFLEQLRGKLEGRIFTFYSIRNVAYPDLSYADLELSSIQECPDGTWNIDVGIDGLGFSIGTFFKSAGDEEPVVWNVNTARTWYSFTQNSIRIQVEVINPVAPWEGGILFVVQE